MVKRYKITYILLDQPAVKRTVSKFGTNVADLEKSFKAYCKEPHKILEIEIEDDE